MMGVQITLVLKANCSGLICEQNYMSYKELIFFITAACVTCTWECASIVENKAIQLNCNLSYPETWIVNIGHNYSVRHEFPALCLAAEFMQLICLSFPLLRRLATVERGEGKQPCKLSLKYRERNIGSNLITDHDFSRKDTFSFQWKYSLLIVFQVNILILALHYWFTILLIVNISNICFAACLCILYSLMTEIYKILHDIRMDLNLDLKE